MLCPPCTCIFLPLLILLALSSTSLGFVSIEGYTSRRKTNGDWPSHLYSSDGGGGVTLRVSEIKQELKERGVSFDDCFDKESLIMRLKLAREQPNVTSITGDEPSETKEQVFTKPERILLSPHQLQEQLSSLSVKELRTQLGERQISRVGLIEKSDLVQALLQAYMEEQQFSKTGRIRPGHVGELTEDEVRLEKKDSERYLLLDVFATWCGPCQLLAKELTEVASNLRHVKFGKVDSDKYPQLSSELKVQGLPTIILFRNDQIIQRMEGALMRDQLQQWIEENIK